MNLTWLLLFITLLNLTFLIEGFSVLATIKNNIEVFDKVLNETVKSNLDFPNLSTVFKKRAEERIINELKTLDATIYLANTALRTEKHNIFQIIENLDIAIRDELKFNDLKRYILYIDQQYNYILKNIKRRRYESSAIIDFCTQSLSHNTNSVERYMRNIHSFITAKDNGLLSNKVNFFDKKSKNDVYRTFSLPAEEVYFDIFYACFAAQMKGFVVMQFSYYYLRLHEKGTFESEINLLRKQNNKFFKEILHEFSNNIQFHSHYELWNDTIPASDKLGITYDVISKLLQGFIQNEESLSDKNSCWKNCDDFTVTKVKNFKGTKCDKKSCNGKVLNCQFISNTLKICPSNKNSLRRYESINNMGSTSLCPNSQCSAQYFRHFLVKCDYCFCICDGTDKYSDRYISLLPVFANVTANKVVTGVRLVKKNRVFFIQIQEGELGTYGAISNRNWVPVEDVNVTNRSFKNNIHYITLNSNRRSLNLKPKILKDNYVVTGIKFEFVHNQIQLNVRGTFYNASNGQLMENKQIWSEPAQVGNELILDKPDVPTKDRLIISNKDLRKRTDKGNNFVKFTHSDIEKDVAQTTIPYIDTQEVTSTFGLLQGVGLIHKGNKGFGGFIAPLLINTNPNSLLKQFLKDTKNDYE